MNNKIRTLLALILSLFAVPTLAQQASLDLSAPRNFVYQDGSDFLLIFTIDIRNPTSSNISEVLLDITMPDGVDLGSIDEECSDTTDGTTRTLACRILNVKANSNELLDFFIDGPGSIAAGPGFTLHLSAQNISIIEANELMLGIADGDRSVRGSSIDIDIVRDISFDGDQNGVPDLDELIINDSNASASEMQNSVAVIDVLFLHSRQATEYLSGKLEDKIAQLIAVTNNLYRNSGVLIKFKPVGLEEVLYSGSETNMSEALTALDTQSDSAFLDVDNMITASGADLVVFLHALEAGATGKCAFATGNGIGRQGDFQSGYHRGELLNVANMGPDCNWITSLAAGFGLNMGIVASREDYPDGGTFSYSAGYAVEGEFRTIMTLASELNFGSAEYVSRFSNSEGFCNNILCGVDRSDLANGVDAVHSMNRTRHVISALTDSAFNTSAESITDKTTLLSVDDTGIAVKLEAVDGVGLINGFADMLLVVENTSANSLYNLNLAVLNLEAGDTSAEIQIYRHGSGHCTVFGPDLATTGRTVGLFTEKAGTLNCFIDHIAPGEIINIEYGVKVDDTPPVHSGDNYYHQVASVNNIVQYDSQACLPVFANFVEATSTSFVCNAVLDMITIPEGAADNPLNAKPEVNGIQISVPYIRLFDGALISAEFSISNFSPLELELVSYEVLDSALAPLTEGQFTEGGTLVLNQLKVDLITYRVTASHVVDSEPVKFSSLVIVQTGP